MALVSENVIDNWFDPSKNSWVYRGFAWLFQNPIWSTAIPKGFSLCPYFWLSVFSWLIFRPLVYAIALPAISLVRLLLFVTGKPLVKLDKWIASRIFPKNSWHPKGAAITLCLALFVGCTMLLGTFAFLIISWWGIADIVLRCLVAVTVLHILGLIIASVYTISNQYNPDRCKPIFYFIPTFILSIGILTLIFPAAMLANLSSAAIIAYGIIAGVLSIIGQGFAICYGALKWVAIKIWAGLAIGFSYFWSGLLFSFLGMAAGLWIIAFGVLSMVLMKLAEQQEKKSIEKKKVMKITNEDLKKFLIDFHSERSKLNEYVSPILYNINHSSPLHCQRVVYNIKNIIVRSVVENNPIEVPELISNFTLEEFQKLKETFDYCVCESDSDYGYLTVVYGKEKANVIKNYMVDCVNKNITQFMTNKDIKDIPEINNIISSLEKKAIMSSKMEKQCAAYTTKAKNMSFAIAKPFVKMSVVSWKIAKELWKIAVYMIILVKSLKKGACPYRVFGSQNQQGNS